MKYRDLGDIITKVAGAQKFSVVKTYCGHGINNLFHTAPSVPHYSKNKAVGSMKPGHTFTIEPMINAGARGRGRGLGCGRGGRPTRHSQRLPLTDRHVHGPDVA